VHKKGHTEEQIVTALQQTENGDKAKEVCRRTGSARRTYYSGKHGMRDRGKCHLAHGFLTYEPAATPELNRPSG
jgi:hypothetical protein